MCGPDYTGKKISDINFEDLPKFQANIPINRQGDTYALKPFEEGRFTLLRELFEVADGILISIDMKEANGDLCRFVDELVREFNREDLTIWGSIYSA